MPFPLPILADLLAAWIPVLLCAAVGYGWVRARRPFDARFVAAVINYLGTPFLAFSALTQSGAAGAGRMAWTFAAALLAFAVFGGLALRMARMNPRPHLAAVMLPSVGYLGLPVARMTFGDDGLALAIPVYLVALAAQFVIGAWLIEGRPRFARLLATPVFYAAGLAFLFIGTETPVPLWLSNTSGLIGFMALPLMLIWLGAALAGMDIDIAARLRRGAGLAALRFGIGGGTGFAIALLAGLDGMERAVFILLAAMPISRYLIAEATEDDNASSLDGFAASIALTLIFMPALILLLR